MKKRKPITGTERIKSCDNEVKPLNQRENPLNTRKGMVKMTDNQKKDFGIQLTNPLFDLLKSPILL